MSKYIVLKPIPVDGEKLSTGTVVDAAGWRNLRTLISGRYLAPYDEPVQDEAVQFVDDEVVKPRRGRPPKQASAPVVEADAPAESGGEGYGA